MKKLYILFIFVFLLMGCANNRDTLLFVPTNLRFEDNTIVFDEVKHATHYVVELNGEDIIIEDHVYPIDTFGTYRVRVKAIAEGFEDSVFTRYVDFEYYLDIDHLTLNYSTFSTFDLCIYESDNDFQVIKIASDMLSLSEEDYVIDQQKLYVKSSYLTTLTADRYRFNVQLNEGSFQLTLNMFNSTDGYMISDNSAYYDDLDHDLVFLFDFFDSTFNMLEEDLVSPTDYVLDEGRLTIKKTYIDHYFETNPRKTYLLIQFEIIHDDWVTTNAIFIFWNLRAFYDAIS